MSYLEYIGYKLDNEFLKILINSKSIVDDNFKMVFKNRETKESVEIEHLLENYDDATSAIVINLKKTFFLSNNTNMLFYDIFIKQNGNLSRISSKSRVKIKEKHRFSNSVYRLNSVKIIVPYLTVNNNFSLIYGDCGYIYSKYIYYINTYNSTSALLTKEGSIELETSKEKKEVQYIASRCENYEWNFVDFECRETKDGILKVVIDKKYCDSDLYLMQKVRNIMTITKIDISNQSSQLNIGKQKQISEKKEIYSIIEIKEIKEKRKKTQVILKDINLSNYDYITPIVINRATKEAIKITDFTLKQKKDCAMLEFQFNKEELNTFENNNNSRWNVYLKLETNSYVEFARLSFAFNKLGKKHERYFEQVKINEKIACAFYLTIGNELSIVVKDNYLLTNEMIENKVQLINIRKKKNAINGKISIDLPEVNKFQVSSLMLVFRNKKSKLQHEFPIKINKNSKQNKIISFKISNFEGLKFEQFYWDCYLTVFINEKKYYLRISDVSSDISKSFKANENFCKVNTQGHVFSPYITRNNNLAFIYREKNKYDTKFNNFKIFIAPYIYKILSKFLKNKEIWLVYEKNSQVAQDNGYYFFKNIYDKKLKNEVYFVIDQDSKDWVRLRDRKSNVITFMSLKHLVYLLASELIIGSESRGHIYKDRELNGPIVEKINEKKSVFLQHGVLGFKKVDNIFNKKSKNGADLFVVSSKFEENIVKTHFKYDEQDILLSGLSRWDELKDISSKVDQKTIFFMPTWRSWLDGCSEEVFIKSDYFKEYSQLFNSNILKNILKKNNLKLIICLHPKFKGFVENFDIDNEYIKMFKFGELPVNEMIRKSSLLITDYSSVAWDFYYLKKPIIFYQFDYEEYMLHQGSYMDMKEDLFGDRILNSEELFKTIDSYVDNEFLEKEVYSNKRNQFFEYLDNKNADRTFELINRKKESCKSTVKTNLDV